MPVDLAAAAGFLAGSGRLLDRRRLLLLLGQTGPEAVLPALLTYGNPDGGFGWGLEPDLRSASSQPAAALHAFEVLGELGGADGVADAAAALCGWLRATALDGGALPFALPVPDPGACAPFWLTADPGEPSLQITGQVVEAALDVPSLAGDPWLREAGAWCLAEAARLPADAPAYELMAALRVIDALTARGDGDPGLLADLAARLPADARLPVQGGAPGEALELLDVSPRAGRPLRALLDPRAVRAALDRLEAGQQQDGGWTVPYASASAAAALEWRGYATVRAVQVLRDAGR